MVVSSVISRDVFGWGKDHTFNDVDLDDFAALLGARGHAPPVTYVDRVARHWNDEERLLNQLRHQLWIAPGSPADEQLLAAVEPRLSRSSEGVALTGEPERIGIVEWRAGG